MEPGIKPFQNPGCFNSHLSKEIASDMAPHEEREKSRASPGRSITIFGPCYLDLVLDCQQCCWHVAEVPTGLGTKNMLLAFGGGIGGW